jgi:hypothetical protein
VYLPKPMTSGLLAQGRFGKQDFVYVAADDVYLCPAGEQLRFWFHEGDAAELRLEIFLTQDPSPVSPARPNC